MTQHHSDLKLTQSILFGSPCPRAQSFRAHGWRKNEESHARVVGSMFHRMIQFGEAGLAAWLTRQDHAMLTAMYEAYMKNPLIGTHEVRFSVELNDFKIEGQIDLVSLDGSKIVDIKTASKIFMPKDLYAYASLSPQLMMYSWAMWKVHGIIPKRSVRFVVKPQHKLGLLGEESVDSFVKRVSNKVEIFDINAPPMDIRELIKFEHEVDLRLPELAIDPLGVTPNYSSCFQGFGCEFVRACANNRLEMPEYVQGNPTPELDDNSVMLEDLRFSKEVT